MRLDGLRRSTNVEHRGGAGGLLIGGGGVGALLIAGLVYLLGGDPSAVLQQQQPGATGGPSYEGTQQAVFSEQILASTEDVWSDLYRRSGAVYEPPRLVTFRGATNTDCGYGQAAMGPFYCPGDQRVYIDLSFYDELRSRFQAPGDFAQAYVIAHEVGHHVQNLLGISEQVHAARVGAGDPAEANALSVRLELQADCFAGVWAHHAHEARQILERGDVEEALGAASAIGDDRLQRRAQGYVVPESFTHGTAEQRTRWFERGLQGGDLGACDTFNADDL
jgi:uncharacterized protein